ncbi:hypothetical protein P167DRAFT_551253 [Morchella conica CCBAS932]|uniref:Pyridoxal phosphate homeostasis protein n=1 Tax=Morchella conica CCBAS932 TaxID=1392247 RepID=A0A3N4L2I3_9PEZI|nr:hypothetical protein P167DRAFT_551253 [Morchella conica CCBAS932]
MSSSSSSIPTSEVPEAEMAARAQALVSGFHSVMRRISAVASPDRSVRLVAVSKRKPASDIQALYNATKHTHYGENYSQELFEKAPVLPSDIQWHFIGTLQTNKCKQLASSIPNLWAVESLDASKKADALNKGRAALLEKNPDAQKLRVFIQVNTSGEESKSGCEPSDTLELAKHIIEKCPHLTLQGFMTIGDIARSKESEVPNEDFILLSKTRDEIAKSLGRETNTLELSMGMSEDYEQGIKLGATNVRVGTSIFGARPQKEDAAAKKDVQTPMP